MERDGELWFVGRDVAQALGYKKPRNALAAHVDADEKTTVRLHVTPQNRASDTAITSRARHTQEVVVISEVGVYGLIMGSELEQARPFKKWVKLLIQRYRQGDITLADEVLQRNTNAADAAWLAARAAVKAGRAELMDVLHVWHAPENRLIENVSKLVTRAVIGRSPAEYREAHGLKKSAPIRDHFSQAQLADVRWLESKLAAVLIAKQPSDHKEAYQACKHAVQVIYGVIHAQE
ncbi:BRO-N domain-containing protein [Deinococcus hopiensis]|uniref:BRO-N domain-containing protein n=1 Tax=Deinococcus hopiensis TaxID=309885 RepID=UPI001481D551|nr:Bro-N domain-containing protein [Deinococcus hopiensis]